MNGQLTFGHESLDKALQATQTTSQTEALLRLLAGESVFLSGLAGTGKTYVIEQFLKAVKGRRRVAVTASTGIAATILGGRTIHSWAGLGISKLPFDPTQRTFSVNYPHFSRRVYDIRKTDTLIIDEISMLSADMLGKVDAACQYARSNGKPFGGLQVIFVGDFMQLPPVGKNEKFAFLSPSWKASNLSYCMLTEIKRAKDTRLQELLTMISEGRSDEALAILPELMENKHSPDKVYSTLYTTNRDVSSYNKREQEKLDTESRTYFNRVTIFDRNKAPKEDTILKSNGIEPMITLKIGDTVMFTQNLDYAVNGTLGKVVGFESINSPRVRLNNGSVVSVGQADRFNYDDLGSPIYCVSSIPLKLAYAITVHKSQGQTFDGVSMDLTRSFTPGLGYVALSRARTFDDIVLLGYSEKTVSIDSLAQKFYDGVKERAIKGRDEFVSNLDPYLHYAFIYGLTDSRPSGEPPTPLEHRDVEDLF